MKASAVQSLESQLSLSRKHFSGSCGDVSELEQRTRDLTLELSTLRAQYDRLQHSVSVRVQQSYVKLCGVPATCTDVSLDTELAWCSA